MASEHCCSLLTWRGSPLSTFPERSFNAGRNPHGYHIWCGHADQQFNADASGLSPWWSSPGEKIDRLFVVMPQSRQRIKFDRLSDLRWLYRRALGQPHQQDFIETVMQMPNDGRQKYVLLSSAWPHFAVSGTGNTK